MRTLVALALVLLAAAPLAGETPDPAIQEALAATLRVLRDPALRSPAVAGSPRAAAIDTEVRAMTGSPQLTQEFYDLAATIFEELAKSSGGDANTMRETLERAAEDPAARSGGRAGSTRRGPRTGGGSRWPGRPAISRPGRRSKCS